MAPELIKIYRSEIKQGLIDAEKADVFSMGVVLIEINKSMTIDKIQKITKTNNRKEAIEKEL